MSTFPANSTVALFDIKTGFFVVGGNTSATIAWGEIVGLREDGETAIVRWSVGGCGDLLLTPDYGLLHETAEQAERYAAQRRNALRCKERRAAIKERNA